MKYSGRSLWGRINRLVHSIRFRITLWTIGILAIVLVAFSAFIFYSRQNDVRDQSLARLDARSRQLLLAYQVAIRETAEHGSADLTTLNSLGSDIANEGDSSILISPDGTSVQTFGQIDTSLIAQISRAWQSANVAPGNVWYTQVRSAPWFQITQAGKLYLVRQVPVPLDRTGYLIIVGGPADPTSQLPRQLWTLVLGSLGILAIALVGGYWLAGRLMAPVRKITRTAQEISGTDLSRRINLTTDDELGELSETFDQMLDRLQGAFDRQRQFTADASHELRTPLTIVDLETARALDHRRSPEDYERALRVIRSENDFMSQLVNNLLTLARMDSGRAIIKPQEIDLSELAAEVMDRLQPLAREKGVEMKAGDLPEVIIQGDQQYLTQMLSNLVENAIKYSCPEEPFICLETGKNTDIGNGMGWIRVEDNGPGIPAEAIPHLFDRFYRVDTARSHDSDDSEDGHVANGSGLGLAIVEWIVHAHQGNIQVASQLGQGSTFKVEFPLAISEELKTNDEFQT